MSLHWKSTLLASAFCVVGSMAAAASLNVSSVTGVWQDVTGGRGIAINEAGNLASWGSKKKRSSYLFDTTMADLGQELQPGDVFSLGNFVHNNWAIPAGSGIKSAQLQLTFNATLTNNALSKLVSFTSLFKFEHTETPNGRSTCANGLANRAGLNANGCADRVVAALNPSSNSTWVLGGTEYKIDVTGFLRSGEPMDEFWTKEGASNRALLQGRFQVSETPVPGSGPPPSPVPLPAAGWMLLTALAGLGYAGRRFNRSK